MRRYVIDGWVRIDKRRARKLYDQGRPVLLCRVNMRPFGPWRMEYMAQKGTYAPIVNDWETVVPRSKFDDVVNSFTYYNCNAETGRFPAYYVKEEG